MKRFDFLPYKKNIMLTHNKIAYIHFEQKTINGCLYLSYNQIRSLQDFQTKKLKYSLILIITDQRID